MTGDRDERLLAAAALETPARWPAMDRWLRPVDTSPIVAQLDTPTPLALLLGADARSQPVDGLNQYGFPPFRFERLVQFSSCTLTIPDGVAIAAVDRHRRAALDLARRDPDAAADALRSQIVDGLAEALELPAEQVDKAVLCPSGTEAELLPVAVALNALGRPVHNIFVGAREAGRGVPVAGAGRWPVARTALGHVVEPGDEVPGLGADLITVTDVDVRDVRGRARRAFDVEAEVEAHVEAALADGCSVIVHPMECSKTGLRYLSPQWVRTWQSRAPQHLRVVVDAAQGRVTADRVRDYLGAGASVLLTGSKAWCGPPFSAVLVPGQPMYDDLLSCDGLPAGLTSVFTRTDFSPATRNLCAGLAPANIGLLLRWLVALDELRRRREIPAAQRSGLRAATTRALITALRGHGSFDVMPSLQHDPTIVTFAVRTGADAYADLEQLMDLHRRAADAGAYLGQPVDIAAESPPVLRAAVGAATISRLHDSADAGEIQRIVTSTVDVLAEVLRHQQA